MKDSTILILVIGGLALLFWASSKGFISASPTGLGINPATGKAYGTIAVPQPSTNYSGYLAASTAPGVTSALNALIGGLGSTTSSWLAGSGAATPTVGQGATNPSSSAPSAAAQPVGPSSSYFYSGAYLNPISSPSAAVGPAVAPELSYGATSGAAFDYAGLASSNAVDPSYSLTIPDAVES